MPKLKRRRNLCLSPWPRSIWRVGLEMGETGAVELERTPLLVHDRDLAAAGDDLTDGGDRDAVVSCFLLEAARMRCFHGGHDLVVVAGRDQLGEKLTLLGDRLGGRGRERDACRLDRRAHARGRAKLGGIADEPVRDVDRRTGALPQRQGKRGPRRGAAVAIDEKRALVRRKTPFHLKPWRSQQLQSERCIADGAADIEAIACYGPPSQHRLALRQEANRGDGDGERPKGGASIAANKV